MYEVRQTVDDEILTRYFSFEMALDHAPDRLGVPVDARHLPDEADVGEN